MILIDCDYCIDYQRQLCGGVAQNICAGQFYPKIEMGDAGTQSGQVDPLWFNKHWQRIKRFEANYGYTAISYRHCSLITMSPDNCYIFCPVDL